MEVNGRQMSWTDECKTGQFLRDTAITGSCCGAGKTAVLVERIVKD